MDNTHFNVFDLFLAVVLLASGVFAFRRGLVKEIMALGTWVLAAIFSFSFYPLARPFFNEHIKNAMLADAATAVGLFCLAIVTLVPLGDYLTGLVKSPTLSSIDRSLGFVFGILRGFVIMCLLYLGTTFVWPADQDNQPAWLQGARTKPALAYGVEAIKGLVPDNPGEVASEKLQKSRDAAKEAVDDAKHLDDISTPVPVYKGSGEAKTPAYGDDTRNEMDNLMDRNGEQ